MEAYSVNIRGASVSDGGRVTKVGVDTSQLAAGVGLDVLDDDVAAASVAVAVAARAVELAEVGDGEAVNGDGADSVVLDDLVLGALSATAADGGVTVTLDGKSVLADGLPPDVFDGAGTQTVDTLDLVSTDDGVAEAGTILKDEDSVGLATLAAAAVDTTAVGLQATVEGASDVLRLAERLSASGRGDGETVLATSDARRAELASVGDSQRGGDGEGGGVLHFGGWW
ncbi:hypothetical protein MPH_02888 [Macrophomina phaseolina MS6]|uniref:Uncharacterized protein n=1 Tax=Macrophomina phaseolina (strain MS6) TaxID=1126212 RepID=K2SBN9_MACPH|nr:hypothetical protein MPH_02888 [Macrophomina phaseolina MS6]